MFPDKQEQRVLRGRLVALLAPILYTFLLRAYILVMHVRADAAGSHVT